MNNIKIIGKKCVGCRSCELSCPTKAIKMDENLEGFIYPIIDEHKCINCGKCLIHCPQNNKSIFFDTPLSVLAAKTKNKERINASASGGICDLISNYIISNHGVVFGAAYDNDFRVKHICITNKDELYKLQSSKYVMSDTLATYKEVKEYLENNKLVLYTGTSCQIDGLYSYLKKDYSNLLTISLICHGTPSYKLFRKYLDFKENQLNDKIIFYNFRSKKKGWGYNIHIKTQTGKSICFPMNADGYGSDFFKCVNYRESCYLCKYSHQSRIGDISVGDYWGLLKEHPNFYSDKGISLVIVNTSKAKKIIDNLNDLDYIESSIDTAKKYQVNLNQPTNRPQERDTFYENIDEPTFYLNKKVKISIKSRIARIIPRKIKIFIKRFL